MKKFIRLLVVFLVTLSLTGCMKMNITVEVKSDLTANVSMELLAEEAMFESTGMTADDFVEEMQDELFDAEELKDAKVSPVSKTIDGSKWVGVSVSGISSQDSDSFPIEKKEVNGKECIVLTLPMDDMNEEMGADSLEDYGYSVTQLKKLGMEMTATIKMPGKVTCDIGEVKGNTVTIDYLQLLADGQTEDIVITSTLSSGMDMTFIFIGLGLVIIAGIVIFILKKKKKETSEMIETDSVYFSNEEEKIENRETDVVETVDSEQEQAPVVDKKYCPNCGQPIGDETACPNCGYELKK